jgi:5-methylcytosine-specific restriction endonuclease McrA
MRQLTRPSTRYRHDLASVLTSHEQVTLASAVDVACAQAIQYRRRAPRLARLRSAVTSQAARRRFLALYDSRKRAVVALKARVWNLLDDASRALCQYCGIGEPRTLDHFVEKAVVPELALYLPNLVPCCHVCNHDRDDTFAADGTRRVLHFYHDAIDRLPDLLRAKVEWPKPSGTPAARYYVAPSSSALAVIYENHFEALGLAARYRTAAGLELLRLHGKLTGMTVSRVTTELRAELAGAAVYGTNDFRAALYRAIIATPAALAWVATP